MPEPQCQSQKTQEIPADEVALLLAMCRQAHGAALSQPLSGDDALVTVGQWEEE